MSIAERHTNYEMRDEDIDAVELALWRKRKAEQRTRKAFEAMPQDEIPADVADRVQDKAMAAMRDEFDGILADLRSGRTQTLVRFTDADHDMMEREQPGAEMARTPQAW